MTFLDQIVMLAEEPEALETYLNNLSRASLQCTVDDFKMAYLHMRTRSLKIKLLEVLLPGLKVEDVFDLDRILLSIRGDAETEVYFWNNVSSFSLSSEYTDYDLIGVLSREDVRPYRMRLLQIVTPVLKITHPNNLHSILHALSTDSALQAGFLEALQVKTLFFGSFICEETISLFEALATPELKMKLLNFILPTLQFESMEKFNKILYILHFVGFSMEQLGSFIQQIKPTQCVQMSFIPREFFCILDRIPQSAQKHFCAILPLSELQSCYTKMPAQGTPSPVCNEIKLLTFLDKVFLSSNVSEEAQCYLFSIFPQALIKRCLGVADPYHDARFIRHAARSLILSHDFMGRSVHFFAQSNALPRTEEEVEFTQTELTDIQNARVRRRGY